MGTVRPLPAQDSAVLIFRSGYASRALYLQAIAQAEQAGRAVVAVDAFEGETDPETDW